MSTEVDPEDPRIDGAGHMAQCMAETLGKEPQVDMAFVIIVKIRDEETPLYRVGAFAPSRAAMREHLRAVLEGMDGDEAIYVDARKYKPEVDGE